MWATNSQNAQSGVMVSALPQRRADKAEQQYGKHEQGNANVEFVFFKGECEGRKDDSRHRRGDQQQHSQLNDGAPAELADARKNAFDGAKLEGFAVEGLVIRQWRS